MGTESKISMLKYYVNSLKEKGKSKKEQNDLIILHIKEDKKDVYRNRAMTATGLIAVVGLLALSGFNIDSTIKSGIEGFDSFAEYTKSILYLAIASLFGTCVIKSSLENKDLIQDINEVINEEQLEIKPIKSFKKLIKSLFKKKK